MNQQAKAPSLEQPATIILRESIAARMPSIKTLSVV
jgi:hypothetical protein